MRLCTVSSMREKLGVDEKVIQVGMFNHTLTGREQKDFLKEGDDGAEEEEEEEEEEVFDDEQLNNMITREEEEVGILCVRTLMEIGFLTTQDVSGVGLVTIILS